MITYELFKRTIEAIQAKDKADEDFTDELEKVCDGFPIYSVDDGYVLAIMEILQYYMSDATGIISWWLYEDVNKVIYHKEEDGTESEHSVATISELYSYLITYCANNEKINKPLPIGCFCKAVRLAKDQHRKTSEFSRAITVLSRCSESTDDIGFQKDQMRSLAETVWELVSANVTYQISKKDNVHEFFEEYMNSDSMNPMITPEKLYFIIVDKKKSILS